MSVVILFKHIWLCFISSLCFGKHNDAIACNENKKHMQMKVAGGFPGLNTRHLLKVTSVSPQNIQLKELKTGL